MPTQYACQSVRFISSADQGSPIADFILQGVPHAERRKFLADMPFAARLAWRLLGRRAFAEEYRSIYGTDPE